MSSEDNRHELFFSLLAVTYNCYANYITRNKCICMFKCNGSHSRIRSFSDNLIPLCLLLQTINKL